MSLRRKVCQVTQKEKIVAAAGAFEKEAVLVLGGSPRSRRAQGLAGS